MAAADIQAKAKARQLLGEGHKEFEGYRTKTTAELQKLIAAVGKVAPAKAQKSAPVKATATKSAPVKSGGKTAPAKKSTAQKSAPVKAAVQGKAKRPSTAKAAPAKKAPAKKAVTKQPVKKAATSPRAKTPAKTTSRRSAKSVTRGERKPLAKKINWNRETNVGQSGKRKEVLDLLREHKGDKARVYKALRRKATKFYPDKDQNAAERMLVWLIGRVAYDYAYKTGQHENGTRAAYGTSTDPAAARAREKRAEAKPKARRTTTRKTTAKPAAARTVPRKATPAKKPYARKATIRQAPAKKAAAGGRKTKG